MSTTTTTTDRTDRVHVGPLVLIPCSAAKRAGTHAAADLYTGSTFGSALESARSILRPYGLGDECIRIVSAKHGLLRTTDVVDTYDVRMGDTGSVTTDTIATQAADQGIARLTGNVVSLLPAAYRTVVEPVWDDLLDAYTGASGIGDQRGALRRTRDAEAHRARIVERNDWKVTR